MPVTPTDELALALDHLMKSVAASASFQSWTSTASEAAALARVHAGEADEDATVPFAVAWVSEYGAERVAAGANDDFESSGTLILQLQGEVGSGTKQDSYIDMLNRVGAIRRELLALSGTAPYLAVSSCRVKVWRFEDATAAARSKSYWVALMEVSVQP